jgi:putative methyltransferase (TIGR04325 family)
MLKKALRPYIPAPVLRIKRALFDWRWFRGRYSTWSEAQKHATGYDQPSILNKVLHATLEVKAGRAGYERDSFLFAVREVEKGLLEALQGVAAGDGGRLRVIDFGGSLGSSYWQHRPELDALREVRWDVVEQSHFVEAGRRFLQDDRLRFFCSIAEAEQAVAHQVLLASGVVHCLPDPHRFLDEFVSHRFQWLVFHNVPLHDDEPDYVMIEHVPPHIYQATYPVWFLNRARFMAHFLRDYTVVQQYPSTAIWNRGWYDYPSTGLVLKLNSAPSP